jgi:hypothetical protein
MAGKQHRQATTAVDARKGRDGPEGAASSGLSLREFARREGIRGPARSLRRTRKRRRREARSPQNPLFLRAGEGIRTLDVHLGKVALYH